jgi:hypothetical protein
MLHFEFEQDRLADPHALKAFELGQGAIEAPLKACFVAEQIIELRCERKVPPKRFQLHSLDSIEARVSCSAQAA